MKERMTNPNWACPECSRTSTPNTEICIGCGHNRLTGSKATSAEELNALHFGTEPVTQAEPTVTGTDS